MKSNTAKTIITLQMGFNIIAAIILLILAILSVSKKGPPPIVAPSGSSGAAITGAAGAATTGAAGATGVTTTTAKTTTVASTTTTAKPSIFNGKFVFASKDSTYDSVAMQLIDPTQIMAAMSAKPEFNIVNMGNSFSIATTNSPAPAGVYNFTLGASTSVDFGFGPRACVVTLLAGNNSTLNIVDQVFSTYPITSAFTATTMTMTVAMPGGVLSTSAVYNRA